MDIIMRKQVAMMIKPNKTCIRRINQSNLYPSYNK